MKSESYDAAFYVDLAFAIVFLLTFLLLGYTTLKSFQLKENRDFFTVLTVFFAFLTIVSKILGSLFLLARLVCLVSSLTQNVEERFDLNPLKLFFYFEVPFDFMINGAIVQFF